MYDLIPVYEHTYYYEADYLYLILVMNVPAYDV